MSQLHKRFPDEQVKVLFQRYCQGQLARTDLQDLLDIGKPRFFALLKAHREDPEGFTTAYERSGRFECAGVVEKIATTRNSSPATDCGGCPRRRPGGGESGYYLQKNRRPHGWKQEISDPIRVV